MIRSLTIILTVLGLAAFQLISIWWPEIHDQGVSPTTVWLVSTVLIILTLGLDRYDRHDQK